MGISCQCYYSLSLCSRPFLLLISFDSSILFMSPASESCAISFPRRLYSVLLLLCLTSLHSIPFCFLFFFFVSAAPTTVVVRVLFYSVLHLPLLVLKQRFFLCLVSRAFLSFHDMHTSLSIFPNYLHSFIPFS